MATAPTFAVFDLFVGQDSLVDWAPPLVGFFLVGEAFFVKLQEAPLGPAIIFWIGGINFAIPVNRVAEALSLFAEVGNIRGGCGLRGNAGFNRVVFRRQAKSIIAKRSQDVQTLLSVEPRKDINNGEVADVADMEAGAGRIREHFSEEHLRFTGIFRCAKRLLLFPDFLPFFFDFERFISIHNNIYYSIKNGVIIEV